MVEWANEEGQADCWPGRKNGQKGGRIGSEMSFSTGSLASKLSGSEVLHSIKSIFFFFLAFLAWNSGFASDRTISKEIEEKAEYVHSSVRPVYNVSCSMDGKYYAGANETKTITVRETNSGKVISKIKTNNNIRSVEFSPSSNLLALGLFNGSIEVYDISTAELVKTFMSLGGPISDMEYSNDGNYFVVAGGSGDAEKIGVKIYDGNSLEELRFINHVASYESFSIDRNSEIFAVSTSRGISLYELNSGDLVYRHAPGSSYTDISLSNNAETLTFSEYIGKDKSFAVILDLKRNKVVLSLATGVGVTGAIMSNDGSMFFVSRDDGVVGIFDIDSMKWLSHATPNGGTIQSMSLCGNEQLITGHWHNAVNVIDISNGDLVRSHSGG